jgi:bifunctional non-homologous end joining protein LigD
VINERCAFEKRPKLPAPVHWIEPRLVCEVEFAEWTDDGSMRHPVFLGPSRREAGGKIQTATVGERKWIHSCNDN